MNSNPTSAGSKFRSLHLDPGKNKASLSPTSSPPHQLSALTPVLFSCPGGCEGSASSTEEACSFHAGWEARAECQTVQTRHARKGRTEPGIFWSCRSSLRFRCPPTTKSVLLGMFQVGSCLPFGLFQAWIPPSSATGTLLGFCRVSRRFCSDPQLLVWLGGLCFRLPF